MKIRFVEKLTTQGATQNIDYSRTDSVGGDNYLFAEDNVLKVEQGQEISVYLDAYGTGKEGTGDPTYDNLQFCFGTGYIDWDLNYQFDASEGSDEVVFSIGTVNKGTPAIASGTTFTFTVPEDAAIGMSRLRIVFSDAWFPHPGPTGATNKGFSIDFPVEISGTNTPRVPAVSYTAYRDAASPMNPKACMYLESKMS